MDPDNITLEDLSLLAHKLVSGTGVWLSEEEGGQASVAKAIGVATQLIVDAGNSANDFFNEEKEKE